MILQIVLFLKDSLDDAQVARLRVQMLVLFFDCNVGGTIEVIRYLFSYGTARVGSFFRAFFFFLPVFSSIFFGLSKNGSLRILSNKISPITTPSATL